MGNPNKFNGAPAPTETVATNYENQEARRQGAFERIGAALDKSRNKRMEDKHFAYAEKHDVEVSVDGSKYTDTGAEFGQKMDATVEAGKERLSEAVDVLQTAGGNALRAAGGFFNRIKEGGKSLAVGVAEKIKQGTLFTGNAFKNVGTGLAEGAVVAGATVVGGVAAGAQFVGNSFKHVAEDTASAVAEGAKFVGGKAVEGGKFVGEMAADAGGKVADRLTVETAGARSFFSGIKNKVADGLRTWRENARANRERKNAEYAALQAARRGESAPNGEGYEQLTFETNG